MSKSLSDWKSSAFALFNTSISASHIQDIGQRFESIDNNEYVLVQNSTVALTAGKLIQHSPIVANHQNLAVTAFTAENDSTSVAPSVTVTLGATKLNTQQYQNGYVVVNAGTGIGQTLRIASCPNAAASATGVVITLEDNPVVALDTTSKVCLIAQPFSGVVINPTTATASPCGVTLYAIPASTANTYDATSGALTATGTYYYGFIQTRGIVSCLNDSATAVGLGIAPSGAVVGAVATVAATTNQIGSAYQAGVDTESRAVYINL